MEGIQQQMGGAGEVAEADIHHISPTLPTEDKALKPNTDESVTDPLKTMTIDQ